MLGAPQHTLNQASDVSCDRPVDALVFLRFVVVDCFFLSQEETRRARIGRLLICQCVRLFCVCWFIGCLLAKNKYFDGDLWIEAFEADTTMTESGKTTVVNIYR